MGIDWMVVELNVEAALREQISQRDATIARLEQDRTLAHIELASCRS